MRRLLQSLAGVLSGLVIAEGAFWLRDDGAFPHLNLYVPDAELGVRLLPGGTERIAFSGNPTTTVRIDAEGYRGGPGDGTLLMLGDSQVFGLGVEEHETAAARLGARNAGVPTYGPLEYLAVLDEQLAAHAPKTVVLVINFSNDLFERERPNRERHAVWDGWAVRIETAPARVTEFPGRRWLLSRSHLVYAARRWWTPGLPQDQDLGQPSEGSLRDLLPAPRVGVDDEAVLARESGEAARERLRVEERLADLYSHAYPEVYENADDLKLRAAREHAHPGDIVSAGDAEEARAMRVTAQALREGAALRRDLEKRLRAWLDTHADHRDAGDIRAALDSREKLDARLSELATRVAEEVGGRSALHDVVLAARDRCRAAGAELLVVALPVDVQVSAAEWAKYGQEPVDMSDTRVLLTDLVTSAGRLGVRALDATDALAAAEPGAFLHADLHMTPKGQAALAEAIQAKLAEPAPLAQPGRGLEPGRSRVPTPADMWLAREIVVKGSTRAHCSTRRLREWLLVECSRPHPEVQPPVVTLLEGPLETMTWRTPHATRLLVPLLPGRTLHADYRWKGGGASGPEEWSARRAETLVLRWEGDEPVAAFEAATSPAPAPRPVPRALEMCDRPGRHALEPWYGEAERGCLATWTACDALVDCASGSRGHLPACPEGQANAGSSGHCFDLCDPTRPCAEGLCSAWQGGTVCL